MIELNLKLLNNRQLEAVKTFKEKVFVVAGAGCGKTRVLTYRIAYLLKQGVEEERIVGFTFTNKAAHEMNMRLNELIGYKSNVTLLTFHSFCMRHLMMFPECVDYTKGFTIIDDNDKKKIIKEIIEKQKNTFSDNLAIKFISRYKNHQKVIIKSIKDKILFMKIMFEYNEILRKSNRMDFDDLLYLFYKLLISQQDIRELLQERYKFILVDECQDINRIQYEIIKLLATDNSYIFMVGDEDQSIYSFRGSDVECVKDFINNENAYVIKLEQNYRSTKHILDAANSVIKNNQNRIDKNLFTNYLDKNFKLVHASLESDIEEATYIADLIEELLNRNNIYKDITILYRNNSVSIPIEKELLKRRIPYYIFGKTPFFKHKEIKTIINYLLFLSNKNDDLALLDIINIPPRRIGLAKINYLKEYSKRNDLSLYKAIELLSNEPNNQVIFDFYSMIEEETVNINTNSINEFLKSFLKRIEYFDFLRNQDKGKEKINNVYTLLQLLKEKEIDDNESLFILLNDMQLENIKIDTDKNYVKMMTIHQAKGLEYKNVIVAGCNDGIIPSRLANNIEEERRIFYVAITRAKERLYLLSGNRRLKDGEYHYYNVSPFILDIKSSNINIT